LLPIKLNGQIKVGDRTVGRQAGHNVLQEMDLLHLLKGRLQKELKVRGASLLMK